MAVIRPFSALRYTVQLDKVVAPPYDVISAEQRKVLAEAHPNNLVHLTLPEQKPDDRNQYVKYQNSAAMLAEWRREGILSLDTELGYYSYKQTFINPADSKTYTRTALFVLLKTEPYENGVVLPHEQTFPKHKEDRLRLLEATRTHIESIYGLYDDTSGSVSNILKGISFTPLASVTTEDGILHELAVCSGENANAITKEFESHKIWIADGHHRYETAMNFRKEHVQTSNIVPQDFMVIALSSLQDDGLIVLPTHRMVKELSEEIIEAIPTKLNEYFNVTETSWDSIAEQVRHEGVNGKRALGIVVPNTAYLCVMKNPDMMNEIITEEHSELWNKLDVTILHSLVMEKLLGLPKGVEAYTRDEAEVFETIKSGEFKAGFIVNPPSVEETRDIAGGGEKMPQKSTFFYPKLLSGLVMWGFGDPIG